MEYNEESRKWTVDRHIPIAIVMAIILQTLTGLWWVATFTTSTEARIHGIEVKMVKMDAMPERIVAVEQQVVITNALLKDIREDFRDARNNGKGK